MALCTSAASATAISRSQSSRPRNEYVRAAGSAGLAIG